MAQQLALYFLGPPQVHLNDKPIKLERRKMAALLAYLALEHGQHQRASLSALFWPDYEQSKAYKNLRQTIWEIQQAAGEGWLMVDRENIGLNEDADIWLDVARFKSLLDQSQSQQEISHRISLLSESASLYRNHFLTGFSLKDAYPFNEWAFAESEDLRLKLANALTMLSDDHCSLNEAEKAIPYARRLITIDPLNETSHRLLMNVYIRAGKHNAALKQYKTLEQTLRKEMGLDPQPETHALYKKIRKGEIHAAPAVAPLETIIPKHNLPHQLSSFIGREKEQSEVTKLLGRNRLVTLVGTGGMGKTSISLQVGHKILNEYPDGVWFIALDSLSDPALLPQTVASIFDVSQGTERPLIDRLIDTLRPRTSLLIFDNCEHLLAGCAQLIATLLSQCPNLRILASSRERLDISGEAVFTTPSLPIPVPGMASLDELTRYGAINLFADRAALASSSFHLTEANIQTVVEICRKVDGIPLAIELAAARVNMLQADEILGQLNDSFALLAGTSQTTSVRHRTLQASMDWDWGLLDTAEQDFLQQLSVFAGGWSLESAAAVCDGNVLDLIDSLVKKSLIVVRQAVGRETRYQFHEIVRQYAYEKLVRSGNEDFIRDRHLKYFLKFSEQIEVGLRGPKHLDWLERAIDERNNIRLALDHARNVDVEAGLYISGRLHIFWEFTDHHEGVRWLGEFTQKPESRDFPLARARALLALGWLIAWFERFSQTRDLGEECLELYRAHGDHAGEADALVVLGYAFQLLDERTKADELYGRSLEIARSIGDARRQAIALFRLGYDRPAILLPNWEKAIDLIREVGDHYSLAILLHETARFHILLTGEIEKPQQYLDEASQLYAAINKNNKGQVTETARWAKSMIALMQGDYEEAHAQLQEARNNSEEAGNWMAHLWTGVQLGYVALRAGNLTEARETFTETAQSFQKDKNTIGVVYTIEGMAGLYIATGKPELAAQLIGWADETRNRITNERPYLEQADVDRIIAACIARLGESAFTEAYKKGEKLALDEAMKLALME